MAYELYALRVPGGGDLEEIAEALAARVGAGIERGVAGAPAQQFRDRLVQVVRGAEETLVPASPEVPGTGALTDGTGLRVDVHEAWVRFRIGYLSENDVAEAVLGRLWKVVAAVAAATDWPVYDPQRAADVVPDAAGCAATLEIYLSVVDQLAPARSDATRILPGERFL